MIEIKIRLPLAYTETDIRARACELLPILPHEILDAVLLHRRLDLDVHPPKEYVARVALSLAPDREAGLLKMKKRVSPYTPHAFYTPTVTPPKERPVVVGAGPAGLFCTLILAEAGLCPILLERGLPVEERIRSVDAFHKTRTLDERSNIQYGEGGAGTFSDGKLKFGKRDADQWKVLSTFVELGAPEDILYLDAPHLGTDRLVEIVKNMRRRLLALGADIRFSHRLSDLRITDGRLTGLVVEREGQSAEIPTDTLFLAGGHSAHDVFQMLDAHGICMEQRPFGIGVRIEHPQSLVNSWAYGEHAPNDLPPASYHFVTHLKNGRSVYSFCMCPGGSVVAATSSEGRLVTNGMSESRRDGALANAAFLVSVFPSDFSSDHPLAGFALQQRIERDAFLAGGGDYTAPAIRMEDFVGGHVPREPRGIQPTYPLGTRPVSPSAYLPAVLVDSLRQAIFDFDAWRGGFYYPDAMLTGAETRSTSPVRILRGEDGVSPTLRGLYPVGEGAGYAGGIVSSAMDGVRAAMRYLSTLKK